MSDLRLSGAARRDLEEIQASGAEQFGSHATRRYMAGFERIFDLLRNYPMAGQERPEFGHGIRTFSHRPHLILYRVGKKSILIARILHASRDIFELDQ